MRASRRRLVGVLVLLSNLCLSSSALAQPSDQVIAERVLGPQWKQLSRRAGMIFAGTVLTAAPETLANQTVLTEAAPTDRAVPATTPSVQLSFRVDHAIAGVKRGQILTIHEWAGARALHRPMRTGQHILIFLYPPSRLGFTSPVGGSLGQVALDASGRNVSEAGFANALQPGRHVPQGLEPAFFNGLDGTAEQAAEKVVSGQDPCPRRLKPDSKQYTYRSAEALRHPKPTTTASSSATCEDGPYPEPGNVSVVQLERAIRSARREEE